ncbi:MAG: hypothetical protein KAQ78_02735 [Candidatus Latescibacteria bacterium]|nr:hypothetical protein [Candidatus Latescibacterota bacterium]
MSVPNTLLDIGWKSQVFLDNYMIETCEAVTRTVHQPKRFSGNPLITKDQAWERFLYPRCNSFSVLYDPKEKLFKAWYEDEGMDAEDIQRRLDSGEITSFSQRLTDDYDNCYLYAESEDGITWRKPPLGVRKINGQDTNICFGDREKYHQVHAATFLLDPFEEDEAKRFKVIYMAVGERVDAPRNRQIRAAYSADGRYWTRYEEPVRFGPWEDKEILNDVIVLSADEVIGQYVLDTRGGSCFKPFSPRNPKSLVMMQIHPNDAEHYPMRRIGSATSKDILHWPMVDEMLVPDYAQDSLDDEYYCMSRFRMGDLQVAFLHIFHSVSNTLEPALIYSRDGWNWTRPGWGNPFFPLGGADSWDRYMVEMPGRPIPVGDELWIYYGGSNGRHDWWFWGAREGMDEEDVPEAYHIDQVRMSIGLAKLRLDGFVSLDTTLREGVLLTRPFISEGRQLQVNVDCGEKGTFEAELLDLNERVIPGYERARCDVFHGNSVRHIVSWKGKKELPEAVLSKGARLRFFSRSTSLYSFCITDGPEGEAK